MFGSTKSCAGEVCVSESSVPQFDQSSEEAELSVPKSEPQSSHSSENPVEEEESDDSLEETGCAPGTCQTWFMRFINVVNETIFPMFSWFETR